MLQKALLVIAGQGGHWLVSEECIGHTVVYKKAPLGLKQHQAVKNQAGSLSHY